MAAADVLASIISGTESFRIVWQEAGPAESGLYSSVFGMFMAQLSPEGLKLTRGNKVIADITTDFSALTTAVEAQIGDVADAAEGELAEFIAAEATPTELAMSEKIATFKAVAALKV
jgi:hypothetical protein